MRKSPLGLGFTGLAGIAATVGEAERMLNPAVVHVRGALPEWEWCETQGERLPRRRDIPGPNFGHAPRIPWTYAWGKVTHVDTLQEYIDTLPDRS